MAAHLFSKLITVSLLACAVAAPTQDAGELVTRSSTQCSEGVHVFVSRGHASADGHDGLLGQLSNSIVAAIPNSSYIITPYHVNPNNSLSFIVEIDPGTRILKDNITSYAAECPNTPIVLIGWSEGSVITMDALCGSSSVGFLPTVPLNSSYASNIIATVVYGDESRVPGQSYNRADCESFGTLARLNPAACAPFASNIRSYCLATDPFCCVGTGNNSAAHGYYFGYFDPIVTQWVVKQYDAFKSKHS